MTCAVSPASSLYASSIAKYVLKRNQTDQAYAEAQAVGNTPALCDSRSAFRKYYNGCSDCLAETGYVVGNLHGNPSFTDFINFCTPLAAATPVIKTSSQEPLTTTLIDGRVSSMTVTRIVTVPRLVSVSNIPSIANTIGGTSATSITTANSNDPASGNPVNNTAVRGASSGPTIGASTTTTNGGMITSGITNTSSTGNSSISTNTTGSTHAPTTATNDTDQHTNTGGTNISIIGAVIGAVLATMLIFSGVGLFCFIRHRRRQRRKRRQYEPQSDLEVVVSKFDQDSNSMKPHMHELCAAAGGGGGLLRSAELNVDKYAAEMPVYESAVAEMTINEVAAAELQAWQAGTYEVHTLAMPIEYRN